MSYKAFLKKFIFIMITIVINFVAKSSDKIKFLSKDEQGLLVQTGIGIGSSWFLMKYVTGKINKRADEAFDYYSNEYDKLKNMLDKLQEIKNNNNISQQNLIEFIDNHKENKCLRSQTAQSLKKEIEKTSAPGVNPMESYGKIHQTITSCMEKYSKKMGKTQGVGGMFYTGRKASTFQKALPEMFYFGIFAANFYLVLNFFLTVFFNRALKN